jgi:amidase
MTKTGANAVVGIKPTIGLLSRTGIIPITADQDTAGPLARNVTDAAVLLGAMTGVDPADPATAAQAGNAVADYTQFLDQDALDGARIGVWREGTFGIDADVDEIMEATIDALEEAGAIIVDAYDPEFTALLCEFKDDIADYLETYTEAGYPKTLQDLIDFNEANPDLEGPWNSEIFEHSQATGGRDADCTDARETANSIAQAAINDTMSDNDLDAIMAPTNGPAWLTDPVNGDLGGDFSTFVGSSSPAAIIGYANVTVPAGYVGELPVGVSFMGGRWDEPTLISLAYSFEQATNVRRPPKLLGEPPDTAMATPRSGSPAHDATSGHLFALVAALSFVASLAVMRRRAEAGEP